MSGNEIKKWSDDKLGFQPVTNDELVCKTCLFKANDSPVGKCQKYNVKPNKVLLGGDCNEYEYEG